MESKFKILGYSGLIPFIAIPIFIYLNLLNYNQGFTYFVQYSAIILSFFGGVHWYIALTEKRNSHQIYVSMLPSILGFLSLIMLEGDMLLMMLSLWFLAIQLYDKYHVSLHESVIIDYTRLRMILTTLVMVSHLIMAMI